MQAEQQSQSLFFAERRDGDGVLGHNEDWNKGSVAYVAPSVFPDNAAKLVIWGFDDVLVNFTPKNFEYLADGYVACALPALKALSAAGMDAARAEELVRESFAKNKNPASLLANEAGVDEVLLLSAMQDLLVKDYIGPNPRVYGMGDQGLLNYFESSKDAGVVHAVVSGSTSWFASYVLTMAVLGNHHIREVHGLDTYGDGQRKDTDGAAILAGILKGVPRERYKDIIVADHNKGWLDAARQMGLNTVYVGADVTKRDLKTLFAAHTVCDTAVNVFTDVLKQKPMGTHRDQHVYAGVEISNKM